MSVDKLFQARFISRPNRFIIRCSLHGEPVTAHLPNSGKLAELLLPGVPVYLQPESAPGRKTRFTCVGIERKGRMVAVHTHRTNDVAESLLRAGRVPGYEDIEIVRREVKKGGSRFDFLLKKGPSHIEKGPRQIEEGRRRTEKGPSHISNESRHIYMEVKSCTLFGEKVAMFPDAETTRGAKHVEELADLCDANTSGAVLFIINTWDVKAFCPNYHTDRVFARKLLAARDRIDVLALGVEWGFDLRLTGRIKQLPILWSRLETECEDRGSYLLLSELPAEQEIPIGRLGPIRFAPGHYIYVGSAMKNLSQRISRHLRLRKNFHWHIDYLRPMLQSPIILPVRSSERLECEIARALSPFSSWMVPRFGSSDCDCPSHLFGFASNPCHMEWFYVLLNRFRMDRLIEQTD